FDLGGQRGNVEVLLENIDLVALLAHLTDGKIDGSGLVYGRIPVSYEAGKIRLDTGYVYAVPGTGHLGIRDDAWMKALMFYVNEAMAGHPYLSLVSERMEQALRDFQYSYLAIDLKKAGSETAARVELRGKGVQGDPPQEIGSLVLNVNDLEELINRVLGFKMTSGESIDRALEDLLDFQ
ncbi:MAG: YdbH domain-containing protein, partial [Desulfobacterales bacterium]